MDTPNLPTDYPYLVDHELAPASDDEPDDYFQAAPNQYWARADLGHAAALLRHVYEHQDDAGHWGQRLQQRVTTRFHRDRVLPLLLAALSPP